MNSLSFSKPNLVNLEPVGVEWPLNSVFTKNTVKYDADWEITNIYENLQIVWSQFFTDMLLFIYIQSTSNLYWFIGIRIRCQRLPTNTYLVTFDYSYYSVGYLMSDNEGNFKLFAPTYILQLKTLPRICLFSQTLSLT